MLVLDESDTPLTVLVHGELALFEGVRGGKLVAETGLEPDELAVAVPVDQVLLPGELLRPGRVGRENRVALIVGVLAAEQGGEAKDLVRGAVVEPRRRVEA